MQQNESISFAALVIKFDFQIILLTDFLQIQNSIFGARKNCNFQLKPLFIKNTNKLSCACENVHRSISNQTVLVLTVCISDLFRFEILFDRSQPVHYL